MREPWERAYFDEQVAPLLGADAVYLGEVPHERKLELLARASALLFPIRWNEPFGMVMLESMACGTPVLAFPEGAVPEVVDDGRTGFLCEDEAAMVDALGRVDETVAGRLPGLGGGVLLHRADGGGPHRALRGAGATADARDRSARRRRRPEPPRPTRLRRRQRRAETSANAAEAEPTSTPPGRGRRRPGRASSRARSSAPASSILYHPARDHYGVVFGDLDAATHIAVIVPGVGRDLNLVTDWLPWAENLSEATVDSAVVLWKGYDDPPGLADGRPRASPSTTGAPRRGRPRLSAFVAGLPVRAEQTRHRRRPQLRVAGGGRGAGPPRHGVRRRRRARQPRASGSRRLEELHLRAGHFFAEKAPGDVVAGPGRGRAPTRRRWPSGPPGWPPTRPGGPRWSSTPTTSPAARAALGEHRRRRHGPLRRRS